MDGMGNFQFAVFTGKLSVEGGIIGGALIISGLVITFAGHRLLKFALFVAGFYMFGILSFIGLTAIENFAHPDFGQHRATIYLATTLTLAFAGGLLVLCLFRLGLSALGALLGFVIATLLNGTRPPDGLIPTPLGQTAFIIAFT
ncbi:hypothetical protein HK102_005349, partial [Quaeritorhiza haematococci]